MALSYGASCHARSISSSESAPDSSSAPSAARSRSMTDATVASGVGACDGTTRTAKAHAAATHAAASEEIASLVQLNIDKVHEIAEKIVEFCAEPIGFEALLQKLFIHYGLAMSFEQYALVGSTVRSYLAWLKDGGRVEVLFENAQLLWKKV